VDKLRRDLRAALRWLVARPGFAVTAIACLALGIGASTGAFSLAQALVWRALPYPEPAQLARVWLEVRSLNRTRLELSGAELLDVRARSKAFSQVGGLRAAFVNHTDGDTPRRLLVARASAGLFTTLGAMPLLGRVFTADEDRAGTERVVILAETYWRNQLGADPDVLGRKLTLDGAPATVVGVLPERFGNGFPEPFQLYLPLALDPQRLPERGLRALTVVARLAPGTSLASAEAELARRMADFAREHPDVYPERAGYGLRASPLVDEVVGGARRKLGILSALVALVLGIAVGNVANLLLARASTRAGEIAIRTSIGGERGDLLRQFLAEALVLTSIAAALGLGLAWAGLRLLARLPGTGIVGLGQVQLDLPLVAFAVALSAVVAGLLALAPFWRLRKPDLAAMFKQGETAKSSAGGGTRRLQQLLVTSQVALACLALVLAGLMLRSFQALKAVPLGFDPAHTLTFNLFLSPNKYPERHLYETFYDQLRERLRQLPGVTAVATVNELPLGLRRFAVDTDFEGHPLGPGETAPMVDWRPASPDYFKAQGIPLVEGRDFTESDEANGEQVAIVSQTVARRYWPGSGALGKQLKLTGRPGGVARWLRIVGVVGDVRTNGIEVDAPMQVYTPYPQAAFPSFAVVLRTARAPNELAGAVRQAVAALDREQPIENLRSMEDVLSGHLAERRTHALLLTVFALAALSLVAVGVHGLMSFLVGQRRSEIGVRMALGAERPQVTRLVLGQVLTLTGWGLALGLGLALLAGRLLAGELFGVPSWDPATLLGVAVLLVALSALAAWQPVRSALATDPINALRRA
jgi:putative ABC transport system permease protein